MGVWGVGTFENDDACDYAASIAEEANLKTIESTLDGILASGKNYLEAPQACEALAAADILARLQGRFGQRDSYTETIDQWVAKVKIVPDGVLVDKARRSIERILAEPSELLELWSEADEYEQWKSAVKELSNRLAGT